jgi:hypothetical protein
MAHKHLKTEAIRDKSIRMEIFCQFALIALFRYRLLMFAQGHDFDTIADYRIEPNVAARRISTATSDRRGRARMITGAVGFTPR